MSSEDKKLIAKFLIVFIGLLFFLWWSVDAWDATYNYYFSDDATGASGIGDDGNLCTNNTTEVCKTLSKAETLANSHGSTDVVNLYFDGGDQWDEDTTSAEEMFTLNRGEAEIVITSYGSGRAIFDGGVPDFSDPSVPDHGEGNARSYNRFFEFDGVATIDNVEIKNVYGNAIRIDSCDWSGSACGCATRDCADGFTLTNSMIYNFGSSAVTSQYRAGIENSTVTYTTMHTGEQLNRYSKKSGWMGAIDFVTGGNGDNGMCQNNVIRYNLVYNIYGEGINASNSTIEYNVVGDTYSIGIHAGPHDYDSGTSIVAYNYLISSSEATYGQKTGIRIYDEEIGGNNSSADIQVYGNISINRAYAFRFYCINSATEECGNPFGSVKVYNNLSIDSTTYDYYIANTDEVTNGYFYNNVSVHYDRSRLHTNDPSAGNWNFSENAFYPVDVTNTVGTVFQNNYITGDPLLPGEPSVDWDGQTGSTYYNNIDFITHLYPPSNSPLIGAGKTLGVGYTDDFLTDNATDFENVLSGASAFSTADQDTYSPWEIGPWTSTNQTIIRGMKFEGVCIGSCP